MQDSLPAGGLRLCRAGVEPAGSLREVSAHVILLPRAFPGAITVRSGRGARDRRDSERPAREEIGRLCAPTTPVDRTIPRPERTVTFRHRRCGSRSRRGVRPVPRARVGVDGCDGAKRPARGSGAERASFRRRRAPARHAVGEFLTRESLRRRGSRADARPPRGHFPRAPARCRNAPPISTDRRIASTVVTDAVFPLPIFLPAETGHLPYVGDVGHSAVESRRCLSSGRPTLAQRVTPPGFRSYHGSCEPYYERTIWMNDPPSSDSGVAQGI